MTHSRKWRLGREVGRAMRWQTRDGVVFWNGRRFRQADQAPKTKVATKGQKPKPAPKMFDFGN